MNSNRSNSQGSGNPNGYGIHSSRHNVQAQLGNQRDTGRNHRNNDETAATFTKEGLHAFAEIFSTSVDTAISNTIPVMIERAVAREFAKLKAELVNEIKDEVAALSKTNVPAQSDVSTSVSNVRATGQGNKPMDDKASDDVQAVVDVLRGLGRPATLKEIQELLPSIQWGSNPSMKMSNIQVGSSGRIERVKRGVFQYIRN